MPVIRLDLEYDGTDFHGFGPQPGLRTVGGELEDALAKVLHERVRVTPAGRTDAGVHARGQVASFRTSAELPVAELKRALNALVGQDLVVRTASDVPDGFDARRSAQSRRYAYAIWNGGERDMRVRRWAAHVPEPLDIERMQRACQSLVGRHDFAAFRTHRSQDEPSRGTVRQVFRSEWSRDAAQPELVRYEIEADAFLRHMVRAIVGSAILVGRGKLSDEAIGAMLASRDRAKAGPTAPPHGLTLTGVRY